MTASHQPCQGSVEENISADSQSVERTVAAGSFKGLSRVLLRSAISKDKMVQDLYDVWDLSVLRGAPIEYGVPERILRVVDMFCGAGGLSSGVCEFARSVGLAPTVELAADFDRRVLEVYDVNIGPSRMSSLEFHELVGTKTGSQASSIDGRKFDPVLSKCHGQVDIFVAGPPCQGFSNLNNRSRRDDDRNNLYAQTAAVGIELDAPLIVIENVPDVRADKRGSLQKAIELLEDAGYFVDTEVVKAVDLGIPQTRKRIFLVASAFARPSIAGAARALARRHRDLRWAIGDLEDLTAESIYDLPTNVSDENVKRIKLLFEKDIYELPDEARPQCHRNGNTYGAVYGRLKWGGPAQTITSGFLVPGRGRYVHPSKLRTITPHEAARIQGFPDSYGFVDKRGGVLPKKYYTKAIGNAVPPSMGSVAAAAVIATVPSHSELCRAF